ncbi:MAG: collagen-like protein [Bacteroidia bacterium]|nr:collagen-like protein [Bacteroidia bacterium]
MKTTTAILFLLTAVLVTSCEGPMGPPGLDGLDGDNMIGTVFEIEGDFTPQNNYMLYYQFPSNFEVYDGDIVLVYILWELSGGKDVWRLLPQTVVLDDGILQYNFDYTLDDVQIFLEGTTDFNQLLPAETNDQVFRIAVLPAAIAQNKSIDVTDLDVVMKSLNVPLNSVEKMELSVPLEK